MKPLCCGEFLCRKSFNNKFNFFNWYRISNCFISFVSISVKVYFYYYYFLERERECTQVGRGTEGGRERERERKRERERIRERIRENPKQAPRSAQSSMWGLIPRLWDQHLSWNQKSDAKPTEPPRCPRFLFVFLFLIVNFI